MIFAWALDVFLIIVSVWILYGLIKLMFARFKEFRKNKNLNSFLHFLVVMLAVVFFAYVSTTIIILIP
jgi:hypothetical protein